MEELNMCDPILALLSQSLDARVEIHLSASQQSFFNIQMTSTSSYVYFRFRTSLRLCRMEAPLRMEQQTATLCAAEL